MPLLLDINFQLVIGMIDEIEERMNKLCLKGKRTNYHHSIHQFTSNPISALIGFIFQMKGGIFFSLSKRISSADISSECRTKMPLHTRQLVMMGPISTILLQFNNIKECHPFQHQSHANNRTQFDYAKCWALKWVQQEKKKGTNKREKSE